ncbi:UNVERIFIED_CONTAM: hypothetical protein Sradi_6010700 [Sesamum radiatum]|uniref:Pentatricopeptide repeat-containing protein n=1 Tax=Sesamum radiatum TaxID=300843 RepID=A0AAW2KI42_SESRA
MENHWVSIHAWNNFLNHLLKIGEVQRFWMVYREMISYEYYENDAEEGIVPNVVGFNMLINGACSAEDLDLAVKLLKKMGAMSGGIVTYGTMIDGYCKAGEMESAAKVYTDMVKVDKSPNLDLAPDFITYTTLVTNLSNKRSSEEVVKLHDHLVLQGVIPDSQTYEAIVSPVIKETAREFE